MFPGCFIGKLGKFADEFLEHRAHLVVADNFGMQVNVGEFLGDQIQQAGLGELVNLGVELETFKNIAHGGRERLEIRAQVFADVILVAHELFQVERRGVVKQNTRFLEQEWFGIDLGLRAFSELS